MSWCGPSLHVTAASACSWLGHPVSGLIPYTYFALFRLAFTVAPSLDLTLRMKLTRWIVLQKARRHQYKYQLRLLVGTQFQDLFHSPPGVLFAFPSRYFFTIGRLRVFSLGGWSPHLQTGFLVSRPTYRALSSTKNFSHTGLSPTMVSVSKLF